MQDLNPRARTLSHEKLRESVKALTRSPSDRSSFPEFDIGSPLSRTPQTQQSTSNTRPVSGTSTPRECVMVDSKEHLSEVVTNLRGISTAMSNVQIGLQVTHIILITKLSDESLPPKARTMVEWLLNFQSASIGPAALGRQKRLHVAIQDRLAKFESFEYSKLVASHTPEWGQRLSLWSVESVKQEANKYDMCITLGGDGTVLFASCIFQQVVPPVLSFALGSLGFMTELEFDQFESVMQQLINDGISCALRMRLHCQVLHAKSRHKVGKDDLRLEIEETGREGSLIYHTQGESFVILNDAVVDRGPAPTITMTELYGNFELLTAVVADGVVIGTPSGSTAYSLSAGGSLLHPDVPATLVTPICPHTLSCRPLILPDSTHIHIGVPYDARSAAFASLDGKLRIKLQQGDVISITASPYPFPKIVPSGATDQNWVKQLGRTLHWNEQQRPKRFT